TVHIRVSTAHRDTPSLPTRRASDLRAAEEAPAEPAEGEEEPCAEGEERAEKRRAQARAQGRHAGPRLIGPLVQTSGPIKRGPARSEEHTSELQSRENLVCRLLLEKK